MNTKVKIDNFESCKPLQNQLVNEQMFGVLINGDSGNVSAVIKPDDAVSFTDAVIKAILEDLCAEEIVEADVEFQSHSGDYEIEGIYKDDEGEEFSLQFTLSFAYCY